MHDDKAREWILTACEVAASIVSIALAIRILGGKDAGRTLVMKGAKASESICQRGAEFLAHMADQSKRLYDAQRNVTL